MIFDEKIKEYKLRFIKGVGETREKILNSLGIFSIEDLLLYFPSRYYDRTTVLAISEAKRVLNESLKEEVTFIGKINSVDKIYSSRRQYLLIYLIDKTSAIKVIFFESIHIFQKIFSKGMIVAFSGKITSDIDGEPVLIHPKFDILKGENEKFEENFRYTGIIVPHYSLRGISQSKTSSFGSHTLRTIIKNALPKFLGFLQETLPEYIIRKKHLMPLKSAIKNLHQPESCELLNRARYRMKFEEIFYFMILSALNRKMLKAYDENIKVRKAGERIKVLVKEILPFELTEDQKKVIREIYNDFKSGYPMNRLLQGDVGSGKTLIALITSLIAIENGLQVALMAPTEILATQHYRYFLNFSKNLDVSIGLLTSSTPASVREKYFEMLSSGELNILIGTHALIEEKVQFKNLGYVIIDEQHRFGVIQRSKLKLKSRNPHLLVITATPIPRTLALTLYSDLDLSFIRTMPKNRKIIKTHVITPDKKPSLYEFIRKEISKGNQAYIVFPLIEESEKLNLEDVLSNYIKLKNEIFTDIELGMIHGRMNSDEKDSVMKEFLNGKIMILISTSVIEVGIDNPNATIMVIEDAQRFGLSQLHQLRGRVGRSEKQSYCILISDIDIDNLSKDTFFYESEEKNIARERLKAIEQYADGFKIAEIDFKLRGPGDIFGTKQSGLPEFQFFDIFLDFELIESVRSLAFEIIEDDPELQKPENQIIKKIIQKKFSDKLFLSTIA